MVQLKNKEYEGKVTPSCYIHALEAFLKCMFPELEIERFAFNLPDNVAGRCAYEEKWIGLNEPSAKGALMALAHEGGHYWSSRRYPDKDFEEDFERSWREHLAYAYGWRLICLIGAKGTTVSKDDWRKTHDADK